MKLINLSNEEVVATEVQTAYHFIKRLRGLMFTGELASGCALHIKPCRSVHTFFMNYAIDVLYLNGDHIVVAMEQGMEPGKVGKLYSDVESVIELKAGEIERTKISIGNQIQIQP